MQIWAESGKSALPICNYSQILYQFLTFTQNLKRSRNSIYFGRVGCYFFLLLQLSIYIFPHNPFSIKLRDKALLCHISFLDEAIFNAKFNRIIHHRIIFRFRYPAA